MHVLLLAPGFSPHSQGLIRALLDAGHFVTLLDHHNPNLEPHSAYRFIPFPGIPGFHRLNRKVASLFEPSIRAVQIRNIWDAVRPDVVNVQGIDARAEFCARATLHPLVLSCWGSEINDLFEDQHQNHGYQDRLASIMGVSYQGRADKSRIVADYKRRIALALTKADHVTGVTMELLANCEKLAGRKLPKSIFRFGVNPEQLTPPRDEEAMALRSRLGIPPKARVLLSIRNLYPLMGHFHIAEAFAEIACDPGLPETILVFKRYLSFESEYERLKDKIKELNLEDRVVWLDDLPADQLPAQYGMADIAINYPEQDGFPVSLIEAAACKRPVICGALAAYDGTFGDSFLMVPTSDATALAAGIRKCLTEDEPDRRARVERAFTIAHEIGNHQKNVEGLVEVFDILRRRTTRTRYALRG